MRLALLTVSTIVAGLLAATAAQAADMVPPEPPAAYGPPPRVAVAPPVVVVEPPPVVVESYRPAPCWRYGGHGWGLYPCVAGPAPYWSGHAYGYRYHYRGQPYWAGPHRWHRSYW